MPMQRHLYPKNWEAIAREIKESANWTCQDCGRPCRRPGESEEALVLRLYDDPHWRESLYDFVQGKGIGPVAVPKIGRFTLTVAHLNHRPEDCRPENLRALCTVCHCRMDIKPGAMAAKRAIALERQGQLNLLDLLQ
jgi:hypothetical protein